MTYDIIKRTVTYKKHIVPIGGDVGRHPANMGRVAEVQEPIVTEEIVEEDLPLSKADYYVIRANLGLSPDEVGQVIYRKKVHVDKPKQLLG